MLFPRWPHYRRALHKGTLRATAHWTYTGRSALFATGEHLIVSGIEGLPGATHHGDLNRDQNATPVHSIRVQPGTISVVEQKSGQQMTSIAVGPGVNLPNLLEFSNAYNMLLAVGDGLQPSDVTRQSANPTSGAALAISAESRREFSSQVLPFFRASDAEAIKKAAWMLIAAGHDVPDSGYSVEYHAIPLTPSEQEDLRKDLTWREERGQMSPLDVHLRLHPWKTREQAREDVIRARVEARTIEAEVQRQLEEEGIVTAETALAVTPEAGATEQGAVQDTALNGAQVESLIGIVVAVTERRLPRESASAVIQRSFNVDESTATKLLGPAGTSFFAPVPDETTTQE